MKRRTHPLDSNIANGQLACWLIYVSRRRLPLLRRLYTAFLNCDIGTALPTSTFLPHPFGIVISTGTVIGEDVVIGQQVTLGNRNGIMAAPIIGMQVYIGAGAKILGPVKIGNHVIIGANAVITQDVPDNMVAVGVNRIMGKKSAYWTPQD
ncbi:MAG: serine acetyltransferase [Verrucomicrobia bacterium]|nr:MAG: serine acetyltransferase [Verrucomicrobiota bacterium]